MRLKRIAEAVMWLPGFAPEDDPIAVHGFAGQEWKGEIIAFPSKEARQSSVMTFWPGLNAVDFDGLSGEVTKFEANCSAIVLLRKLEDEGRGPTTEERTILNRYTGWGGLPWAFNPDQDDSNRKIRVERLQTLLAEDEYESARASTNSAHYTSVEIIDAMWAAVRRLGFTGGRILEPSAGNGYFLGAMPREVAEKSTVTAIEIDQLSARLLTSLYGDYGVRVANEGFEVARLPADFFDLVISNVPFGNYQTPETRHVPFRDFLIHDYFFARALEVVRPGGLVAFITSAGTLDKSDTAARKYLANRARLLGSIRLPLQAFQKIANTEVTTDIVFLQKLKEGEAGNGDDWAEWPVEIPSSHIARDAEVPAWQWRNVRVCKWFAERPEWIVGKLTLAENGYGKANACTFEGDIGAALLERVALLPEGVYRAAEQTRDRSEGCAEVRVLAGNFVKPGAYKLVDGKVAVSEGHELRVVEGRLSARAVERIRGMIEIRDAARKLVAAQASSDDDTLLGIYRVVLNAAYDAFSAKCGHIHAKANRLAFRGDPDLPLLLSLERLDEETQTAEKMDIFHRRTVGAARQIECCETPEEALIASIQQTGRVSVARMEALLGQPGYEFIPQLQEVGAIFLNPDSGSWETADTYLAGNVRQKLMFAENAGRKFASNAEALKAVIPDDLAPHEIGARIGSVWIPATDYQAFLDEIMECEGNSVEFNATAGAWQIDPNHATRWSVAATQTYGTERVGAMTLFEQALNQQVPTVTDPAPDDRSKRIVNQKETIAAREKLQELREKFQEWLWLDDERTPRLVRLYNDQFNCIVQRRYDGKHLVLPGFSQVYRLHDHQRDAIWRVVSCKSNTLLAHVVGAGKTLTMICAGMELRRLGVAGKPCYVVPNHMLEQFAAEFLRAYPGANILMASKDDLQGDKRRTLLSRIATGDWDGVLITHSSFERIKLGDGFIEDFIQKQIDEIEQAIRDANQNRGNRIVKELERAKKVWLARLTKLAAREKKDDVLTFDELGIDWLFVDEAHLFKNLYRFTKMTRVAGLPNSNSERAFDMFLKTRCVMARHQGRAGVAFATGTPVSNSMAEMWTMQRYLQPDTLSAFRLQQFDTWAGNFGESVTALELAPDGRGYRMHTRFARFVNLPELMSMFGQVADIRTAEMLKLPVPRALKETATAKPTPELKAYVQTLVERSEAIRNGTVTPQQDNMLAVTGDGRKAALDMRLVDPFAEDYEGSKTNQCAEKVFGVWKETASTRGTQIIFCDLSTPVEDGRFSVYQDLRRKLIEMGVPVADIAFIHDYDSDSQKEELFKAVREGRVRVVLGSTQKMPYQTKSLLNPAEHRLALSIEGVLAIFQKPSYKLLYKVQPSVFFDPNLVSEPRLKNACFDGLITIAIVENKPIDAHLLVAILDNENRYSVDVRDLLKVKKTRSICCDFHEDIGFISALVQEDLAWHRSTGSAATKGQGNLSEKWLVGRVKRALERFNERPEKNYAAFLALKGIRSSAGTNPFFGQKPRVRLFQESCLAEFIDVSIEDRSLFIYARQSRVDVLITGPDPNFKPFLVLEIDGPDHETEKGQAKDKKKETILLQSKVPLVRLRLSDMPFHLKDFEGKVVELSKSEERNAKRAYEDVFSEVIGNILAGVLQERVEVPKIWANHERKWNDLLKMLTSEYRKKQRTLVIPEEALQEMWHSIDEQLEDSGNEAMTDEYSAKSMLNEYPGSDKLLTLTGASIDDLAIDASGATAMLNLPNGKGWFIKVPPVHLKYVGEGLEGYQEAFNLLVPQWLTFMVRRLAEGHLSEEKVPELISWEQLQAFKEYWGRPWKQQEKALLATLVAEGRSMDDIAKRLERSEYAVALALRPRSKKAIEQRRIDRPMLVKRENSEAIRCVQNGIVPNLA